MLKIIGIVVAIAVASVGLGLGVANVANYSDNADYLREMTDKVVMNRGDIGIVNEKVNEAARRLGVVEGDIDVIEDDLDALREKFNDRLVRIENTFGRVESDLGKFDQSLGAITFTEGGGLVSNSITSAMIVDGVVAAGDLATSAVTSVKILDETIVDADIDDDALTSISFAAGSVGTGEILDATITDSDVAADTFTSISFAVGSVGTGEILNATIVDADIAADTLTSISLAVGSVGTGEILDATIATADLANDAVTSAKTDEELVQNLNVTISSASIDALNATPYTVIAAPGADKFIDVISVIGHVNFSSESWNNATASDSLTFRYTDGSGVVVASLSNDFVETASDGYTAIAERVTGQSGQTLPVTGAPIVAEIANDLAIDGATTFTFEILYRVVSF